MKMVTLLQICSQEVVVLRLEHRPLQQWMGNLLAKYGEVLLLSGLTLHEVSQGNKNLVLIGLLAVIGSMMFHYSLQLYRQIMMQEPRVLDDMLIKRDVRFVIIGIGALLNLPSFTLAIMAVLFNAIVIRRMIIWGSKK